MEPSRTSHEVRGLKLYICVKREWAHQSHLTRGAWIEIDQHIDALRDELVAPHTRCVDWNDSNVRWWHHCWVSHLTRGAWIEIIGSLDTSNVLGVAPHTRCVDWNINSLEWVFYNSRRTSHEVRGLKSLPSAFTPLKLMSHLTRGAWIEML